MSAQARVLPVVRLGALLRSLSIAGVLNYSGFTSSSDGNSSGTAWPGGRPARSGS